MIERMIEFRNGPEQMRLRWEGDAPTPHTPPGFAIRRLNFCWFKATPALAQKKHQFFRDAERKWRTVGYFDIQEFKIILSRQIDRFFVERNLQYTCGIQFDVFGQIGLFYTQASGQKKLSPIGRATPSSTPFGPSKSNFRSISGCILRIYSRNARESCAKR
jgi:hypothetical protein